MKLITTLLIAVLLCGYMSAAEPVTLRGVNGREIIAEVVRAGTVSLIVRLPGETEETAVKWTQLDMEHLKANHPAIAKMKDDADDRAKNGVFAATKEPAATKPLFPDTTIPWVYYYAELPSSTNTTFRQLMSFYASSEKGGRAVVKNFKQTPALSAQLIAGVKVLSDAALLAKDPQAPIYVRALEKLEQQAKDNGVRRDTQSAVADLLKVLDAKK